MSLSWFKNHVGFNLSEEQMHDIPYPYVELHTHVIIKSIQAFGLLGTCFIGPISALARGKTRSWNGIKSCARSCGKWGALIGIVAGPLMTNAVLKGKKADRDSVYDRCYRLRNNRGQVRVDRGSVVGAVGGAAISVSMQASPVLASLVGMSAGVISMAVYNNVVLKKK